MEDFWIYSFDVFPAWCDRGEKCVCVRLKWTKMGGEKEREWEKLKPRREHCETGSVYRMRDVRESYSRIWCIRLLCFSPCISSFSESGVISACWRNTRYQESTDICCCCNTHTHTHTHARRCRDEPKRVFA